MPETPPPLSFSSLQEQTSLKRVLDAAADAMFVKNADGHYVLVNSACAEILGLPAERILGRTDTDIFGVHDGELVRQDDQIVMRTQQPHTFEKTLTFKGQRLVFSSRKTVLRDANGKSIGIVGIARDVTALKQIANDLQQKANLLEVLNSAMAAYLDQGDWAESMTLVLRAALQQTGGRFGFIGLRDRPGELIIVREGMETGRSSGAMSAGFISSASDSGKSTERLRVDALAAWFPPLHQAVSQVLQTGKPLRSALFGSSPMDILSGTSVRYFLGIPIRRGSTVIGIFALCDAPEGFSEEHQRWLESGHEQLAVLCSVYLRQLQEEILEQQRQQAEKSLRETHSYIQQIMQSAQEGIIVYDTEMRYRVWNPYMEWLTGLKEKDVLGRQPLEFFPFLTKHGVDLVHHRALKGETLESEPIRYELGAGRDGWSSGVWGPLRDSEGKIIGALGFVRDITERVRTQDRLQTLSRRLITAQEQERRHLAIELHDEIGQVLTAVTLNLKSLLNHSDVTTHASVQDCMAIVQDAVQRVRELSLNLRPSLLDDLGLEPALRWFLDQQGQRAGMNVHLECTVRKGDLAHDIETASFRIVQESVTNTVRHSKASSIRVRAQIDENGLHVEVQDDGVGFKSSEAMARTAAGKSCGIVGMHERVELLGGRFQVDSTSERGTLVSVTFPNYANSNELKNSATLDSAVLTFTRAGSWMRPSG